MNDRWESVLHSVILAHESTFGRRPTTAHCGERSGVPDTLILFEGVNVKIAYGLPYEYMLETDLNGSWEMSAYEYPKSRRKKA